jgi:hypothetical protein
MGFKTWTLYIPLLFLAVLGIILSLITTSTYGPAVGEDSIFYMDTAKYLANGHGFTNFNGYYVYWPPFYPLLLTFFDIAFRIQPFIAGGIINAAVFGATIFLAGVLFLKYFSNKPVWAYIGAIMVFLSYTLFSISVSIGTDIVFVFFVLIFLLSTVRFLEKGSLFSFIIMSLAASLSVTTRYIGFVLILLGFGIIIFCTKTNYKKLIVYSVIFLTASSLPIGIWIFRNYLVSNTFTGYRNNPIIPLFFIFFQTSKEMAYWFIPPDVIKHLFINRRIFVFIFGLLAALILYGMRRNNRIKFIKFITADVSPSILISTAFLIVYLIAFILSATQALNLDKTKGIEFGNRFLAPIVIPTIFLVLAFIEKIIFSYFHKLWPHSIVYISLWICFFVWTIYPIRNINYLVKESLKNGVITNNWANTRQFHTSQVVKYISQNKIPSGAKIISNYLVIVYYFSGQNSSRSPIKERDDISDDTWLKTNPTYLVWFEPNIHHFYYTPSQIMQKGNIHVSKLFESKDGGIYLLSR